LSLLERAAEGGIRVSYANGEVQLQMQKGLQVDRDLLSELKNRKVQLKEYLETTNGSSTPVPLVHLGSEIGPLASGPFPLSFNQESLWFVDRLQGSLPYHLVWMFRIKGVLDIPALELAFREVISRHESLRTVIRESEGEGYQYIQPPDNWRMEVIGVECVKNEEAVDQQNIDEFVGRPFVLSDDYMIRVLLSAFSESEYSLTLVIHHIAFDAWSMSVVVRELMEVYEAKVLKRPLPLKAIPLQYKHYSIWQRRLLTENVLEEKMRYWRAKLDHSELLKLPEDIAHSDKRNIRGGVVRAVLGKDTLGKLKAFSNQESVTLFMTLLAIFKVLLWRYSRQPDISIGASISNRRQHEMEEMVGFFANTLVLRSHLRPKMSFPDLLQQVRETVIDAIENQEVPFEAMVRELGQGRAESLNPFYNVMFVFHNTPSIREVRFGEASFESIGQGITTSKSDITFDVMESQNGLQLSLIFKKDLYREESVQRMLTHFECLIQSVLATWSIPIDLLSMITSEERQGLMSGFGVSVVDYPREKSIVNLFQEQACLTPDKIAVVTNTRTMTYQELDEWSNRLGHYLREAGVTSGAIVAIGLERGWEMIACILGIMKAGAAYLPLDLECPADRIEHMLSEAGAILVLCSSDTRHLFYSRQDRQIIEFDKERKRIEGNGSFQVDVTCALTNLAYVIFTSGSTGLPKGVMVQHRNIVDYVYGLNERVQISKCDSFGLVSTAAADLGNTVIYSSLVFGGTLHIFSKEEASDGKIMHDAMKSRTIDCLKIVPSHWLALSSGEELVLPGKLLIFGGEVLPAAIVNNIRSSGATCKVINHYGPTETTIGKLLHVVEDGETYRTTVPIGKPFSNTTIYLLTEELALCPIGVPGYIYIGGEGVTAGYINRPDLTKGRFIENPFGPGTLYQTGDLGRWLPDGNLDFMGRNDQQLKIRGYRVEPAEIERVFLESGLAAQAAVIGVEGTEGDKRLAAFWVPLNGGDDNEIMQYLMSKLPGYLVPGNLIKVDSLPVTSNGKMDRRAMTNLLTARRTGRGDERAETVTERAIIEIWQEILEVSEIGLHEDFFGLGGHSLLAIRLVSVIRKRLEVEISLGDVFDYPTVAVLARRLDEISGQGIIPGPSCQVRPTQIPLSFGQERLWFIDQLQGSVHYHIPHVVRIAGRIDVNALSRAFAQLVERHEVLRTAIKDQDGVPYQEILEGEKWELVITEMTEDPGEPKDVRRYLDRLISRPFDLGLDHPLRAELIRIKEDEYVLAVVLHHIASDGWSLEILVRELTELYAAAVEGRETVLERLPIQYADYALWQRKYLSEPVLEESLGYWKKQLRGVPVLELPTDHRRPPVQSHRGWVVRRKLGVELRDGLVQLSQEEGVTLYMTLLAAFQVLLHRYSGQEDICVGSPIAGRMQQDVEGLVGFFINTLALRSEVKGELSFEELLRQVKEVTLAAYRHQEVPFEKVVDAVVEERDLSRSFLFQAMFTLQKLPEGGGLKLGEALLREEENRWEVAKFDLSLNISEELDGLGLAMVYCRDLYDEGTVERMLVHYERLLLAALSDRRKAIGQLRMVGEEELRWLEQVSRSSVDFPEDKTVVDLFEDQVKASPEAVALVDDGERLSYAELNERANQVGRHLRSRGLRQEEPVLVLAKRSMESIIGMLGILKAGGMYVPIDVNYPDERVRYLLSDTGCRFGLGEGAFGARVRKMCEGVEIIDIGKWWSEGRVEESGERQGINYSLPDGLAYIIYTSGTTGRPKGVMIGHRSLVDHVYGLVEKAGLKECRRYALFASLVADAGHAIVFASLTGGGELHMLSEGVVGDGMAASAYVREESIDCIKIVPSLWMSYNEGREVVVPGKVLLFGGEALLPGMLEVLAEREYSGEVYNHYGPTEATIGKCIYKVELGREYNSVPIGVPFSNTRVYVLDDRREPCGIGVTGELCIAGVGVARGYWGRPELTEEKFVADPFVEGERMYRTGDRARWLMDGNIELLGRKDQQVKLRGYRIELGEVETVLAEYPGVCQGVVAVREDGQGNQRLVAYVVIEGAMDKKRMEQFLRQSLPEYMVPRQWVALDAIPLTESGKVDRRALPAPETIATGEGYVAPGTEAERMLAEIWAAVLGLDRIGIDDNFFEHGGTSLLLTKLAVRLRRYLQIEFRVITLFEYPTIRRLADHLEVRKKADAKMDILGREDLMEDVARFISQTDNIE